MAGAVIYVEEDLIRTQGGEKMKKLLSLLTMVVLMLCFCVSAFALEEEPPVPDEPEEPYMYTQAISSTLSISGNTATCVSQVTGKPGQVTLITITQYLQKKNGSTWTTIDSWTKSYPPNTAVFVNTKSGLSSGQYRVFTSAVVYHNTFPEFVTAYSTVRTV